MNDTIETPRDALIDLIVATRNARSAEIIEQAREQARSRIRTAFSEARQRVSRALDEERVRAHGLLALNAAQLETHNRQRYQDAVQHMLRRARYRLGPALLARWQDRVPRRLWVDDAITHALRRLPASPWTVEHPLDWDGGEITPWVERIRAVTGGAPVLRGAESIRGGLRIQAGGASLDATVAGLLADERAVQARLLARLEAALARDMNRAPDTGAKEPS